jgi:hypothetical protein
MLDTRHGVAVSKVHELPSSEVGAVPGMQPLAPLQREMPLQTLLSVSQLTPEATGK